MGLPLVQELSLIDGDYKLDIVPSEGVLGALLDLGSPEVRDVVHNRPASHGQVDHTDFVGARPVSLEVTLVPTPGKTAANWRDELGRFLHPRRRPYLRFRLRGQEVRQIQLRGAQFPMVVEASNPQAMRLMAQWSAPSGRIEAANLSLQTANPSSVEEGRAYDLTYDRAYPFSPGLGVVIATNQGNIEADPVLRIFGPCTGPKVTNESTGDRLFFKNDFTINAGDWIEIDTIDATVLFRGRSDQSRFHELRFEDSRFWSLEPGDNHIRYHPEVSDPPSQVEIRWRHQWL